MAEPKQDLLEVAQKGAVEKERAKNEALLMRRNAMLKAWPNGTAPKSREAWEESLGRPLSELELEIWTAYEKADNAYKNAVHEAKNANAELANVLKKFSPNDFGGEDWDTGTPNPGYSGNFHARSQVKTGEVSWADVDPPTDLLSEPVEKIDLNRALTLAQGIDKDIDGKHAAGTSTLKEGEEKFTVGASYAGTQGVSISEVAGVSAAYVHGKRVAWLDGDTWAFQKGGWTISSVDVQESRSTTTVGQDQVTTVKVKGRSTSDTVAGSLTRTTSAATMHTVNTAEATISTINAAPLIFTLNSAAVGVTFNAYPTSFALALSEVNTSAAVSHVATCVVAMAPVLINTNIAEFRQSWDHTSVSALVYDNVGISVQGAKVDLSRNSLAITEKYLDKHGIKASAISQSIAEIKQQVKDTKIDVENSKTKIVTCETTVNKIEDQVKMIRNSVTQTDWRLSSGGSFVSNYSSQIVS